MASPVKKNARSIWRISVKFFVAIFAIFRPNLKECRQMIGRIGPAASPIVWYKGDLFVFNVDHILYAPGSVFAPHCIEDSAGFGVVINSGIISPAIGGK